jgi:hypothetical protein
MSDCDMFSVQPTQTSIIGDNIITLKPVSSLDSKTQIEFNYSGAGLDKYVDLSDLWLRLEVSLTKSSTVPAAGAAPAVDKWETGFVNNALWSFFSGCEIYINEISITPNTDHFNTKRMLHSLLHSSKDAVDSYLTAAGFALDIKADGTSNDLKANDTNIGWAKRLQPFLNGNRVVLRARLFGGIFDQHKLLPSGCTLRIKFVFAEPNFYLWTDQNTSESELIVRDATLELRQVQVSQATVLSHKQVHEKKNMIFEFNNEEIKTFTLPTQIADFHIHNCYSGILPDKICVAFCSQTAFHGNIKQNPYHFSNVGLTSLSLYLNGVEKRLDDFSFANNGNYNVPYTHFHQALGTHHNEGKIITYPMYGNGYTLFYFDLTPDKSGHIDHKSIKQIGNLRIKGTFSAPTTTAVTVIVYSIFPTIMELDKYMKPVLL